MTESSPGHSRPDPEPAPPVRPDDEAGSAASADVLPARSSDEYDVGWGERPEESDRDDLDRFLRERPPHHE